MGVYAGKLRGVAGGGGSRGASTPSDPVDADLMWVSNLFIFATTVTTMTDVGNTTAADATTAVHTVTVVGSCYIVLLPNKDKVDNT